MLQVCSNFIQAHIHLEHRHRPITSSHPVAITLEPEGVSETNSTKADSNSTTSEDNSTLTDVANEDAALGCNSMDIFFVPESEPETLQSHVCTFSDVSKLKVP